MELLLLNGMLVIFLGEGGVAEKLFHHFSRPAYKYDSSKIPFKLFISPPSGGGSGHMSPWAINGWAGAGPGDAGIYGAVLKPLSKGRSRWGRRNQ